MTLAPSGIWDDSNLALDVCAARVHSLPLSPLLTHLVDVAGDDVLPHLAQRFHILHTVAWRNSDDIKTRRGLIKAAMRRHRLKGTLAGFKLAATDVGCAVTGAITPPSKVFPSPSLTVAERNAFVARYPQLRIYRYRTAGMRIGLMVGEPLGLRFPVVTDAELRLNPRAWIVKDEVATELTIMERTTTTTMNEAVSATVTEAAVPGSGERLAFACRFPRYLTVTTAPRRFYRITIGTAYRESVETLRRVAAVPGLDPIDIRPDNVTERGVARGLFIDRFAQGYFNASTAADRIYQRLYLFDPEIDIEPRKAIQHLNAGRLSMPRHHAELTVSVPGRRAASASGRYIAGHLVAQPKTRLADLREAMQDMARVSDRVALDLTSQQVIAAGATIIAGERFFGEWTTH